jgi:hypothetical protein
MIKKACAFLAVAVLAVAPASNRAEPLPEQHGLAVPEAHAVSSHCCAGGHCQGSHWHRLVDWLTYQPPCRHWCCCGYKCYPCCHPPLFAYFLGNCCTAVPVGGTAVVTWEVPAPAAAPAAENKIHTVAHLSPGSNARSGAAPVTAAQTPPAGPNPPAHPDESRNSIRAHLREMLDK